jgi:N-methylhydantoinase B
VLVKHSSGGGGVGDPAARDPEMVRADVENELVSLEAAREVYKVALDPHTLKVDEAETRRLRSPS